MYLSIYNEKIGPKYFVRHSLQKKIPLPGEVLNLGNSNSSSDNNTTLFYQNLGYYNVTRAGYSYIR